MGFGKSRCRLVGEPSLYGLSIGLYNFFHVYWDISVLQYSWMSSFPRSRWPSFSLNTPLPSSLRTEKEIVSIYLEQKFSKQGLQIPGGLHQSAQAAITEYHRLCDLNNKIHFLNILVTGSSILRCWQCWFLVKPKFFLVCKRPPFHFVFPWPFLCEYTPGVTSLSHKDINPVGLRPHPYGVN